MLRCFFWGGSSDLQSEADLSCVSLYLDNSYDCYQNRDGDDCEYEYYPGSFYYAEDQELFLSALFATEVPQTPCEIGISRMMLSTGDSFQLYAEQYTEHALVVQYKDQRCYLKLAEGKGGLNIMADGAIYHVIE